MPDDRPRAPIEHRRVIVKVGTNLLTGGGDALDADVMSNVVRQIAAVRERGSEVIVVTSGAIAAGRQQLGDFEPHRDVPSRQVLAAVGQSRLMAAWDRLFDLHGLSCAQTLLTRRDLADRPGYLNARNTLLSLLALGVVPVVNENDVVSMEEIQASAIGDNDNLSAQVANLVDADLLLMLTTIDGLYTADPSHDPDARMIERIERIDAAIEHAARGAPGERGTGGMVTKVEAARIATQSGTHVVIADGRAEDVILRAAAGETVGTHFLPTGDRTESRRRYLLSGLPVRGHLVIDDGAARALEQDGKSLLPAGIVEVDGNFQRGDVVRILSAQRQHLANGMSNYGATDVARIRGLHSDRIAGVLGYEYGEEVVHRSNMVLV